MRLLYATSIKYPSALANRIQALSMSKAFSSLLGADFYLGGNEIKADISPSKIISFGVKKSWKLAWKVLHFAKSEKITHIYCREARLLFFIVFYNFLLFRLPLKFGYEVHALLGRSGADYVTDALLTLFVGRYFFVTKALREVYCKKYRVKKEKTMVVPDSVDLSIFDISISKEEARKKLDLPVDRKIIGFCGRFKTLNMDKGINDILAAVKILAGDVSFVAIGGSEEDIEFYKKKAEEIGVEGKYRFLGNVAQKELAIWQKSFDVLLMPFPWQTHFAYYMSPLKMFEYMASKRPIIASDLPSEREILNEGNAVIVPPDKPESLAAAISMLLSNPNIGEKMAGRAFQDVQNYTWQKRAEKILMFVD